MKPIYPIFFLIVLLCSCDKSISDFQSENFVKYFGTGYESRGYDVIELSDSSYALTGVDYVEGTDYQIFVAKVNKYGNQIWNNSYGLSEVHEEGRIIKEAPDGLLVAGTSINGSGGMRSFIMKTGTNGDSLWYREFGDISLSIEVNDIFVSESSIFIAGKSFQAGNTRSDYYTAMLSLTGELVWERVFFLNSNSRFIKVFIQNDNLLFIGNDGIDDNISIVTSVRGSGIPIDFINLEIENESAVDASLIDNKLFILSNTATSTQLRKLSSGFVEEWQTESIPAISGKSFAQCAEGSLILGESVLEGSRLISAIKVDAGGGVEYGPDFFRTIPGTISSAKPTNDNGLIIIGSTNATFGTRAQLIKTDADLFLLKP